MRMVSCCAPSVWLRLLQPTPWGRCRHPDAQNTGSQQRLAGEILNLCAASALDRQRVLALSDGTSEGAEDPTASASALVPFQTGGLGTGPCPCLAAPYLNSHAVLLFKQLPFSALSQISAVPTWPCCRGGAVERSAGCPGGCRGHSWPGSAARAGCRAHQCMGKWWGQGEPRPCPDTQPGRGRGQRSVGAVVPGQPLVHPQRPWLVPGSHGATAGFTGHSRRRVWDSGSGVPL